MPYPFDDYQLKDYTFYAGVPGPDICQACGAAIDWGLGFETGLCYDCDIENAKVRSNNARARQWGQPATLTVYEWLDILDFFGHKCAYCRARPYEVLEHFDVVEMAGTTAANCVPSCKSCDKKKIRRDGIHGTVLIPGMDRVRAYLAQVQSCLT